MANCILRRWGGRCKSVSSFPPSYSRDKRRKRERKGASAITDTRRKRATQSNEFFSSFSFLEEVAEDEGPPPSTRILLDGDSRWCRKIFRVGSMSITMAASRVIGLKSGRLTKILQEVKEKKKIIIIGIFFFFFRVIYQRHGIVFVTSLFLCVFGDILIRLFNIGKINKKKSLNNSIFLFFLRFNNKN